MHLASTPPGQLWLVVRSAAPLGAGLRLFSHHKHPLLRQPGRVCRAAGRVEELFQWLYALGMNYPMPVVASGPVGTSVPGWLASALPPERSLASTQLRQDVKTAERTNVTIRCHLSFVTGFHGLSWQWAWSAQLFCAIWCLFFLFQDVSC